MFFWAIVRVLWVQIRELFFLIDADGNGSLDLLELRDGLASMDGNPASTCTSRGFQFRGVHVVDSLAVVEGEEKGRRRGGGGERAHGFYVVCALACMFNYIFDLESQ